MQNAIMIICAALIATGAIIHGQSTRRWQQVQPESGVMSELHKYQIRFADCTVEDVHNDMPVKEKSHATSRRYTSSLRGLSAVVTIITGPPGAVATHTPDVCYPSSGYKTLRGPIRETLELPGGAKATYYIADFEKSSSGRVERQRVLWSWSTNGTWLAPNKPRWEFLKFSDVSKLYLVTSIPDLDKDISMIEETGVDRQFIISAFAQYAGVYTGH